MNTMKAHWILLVLFCVLTVVLCVCLILTPATGDKWDTVGRIGLWGGVIANLMLAVLQVFEIRRKKRDNKQ